MVTLSESARGTPSFHPSLSVLVFHKLCQKRNDGCSPTKGREQRQYLKRHTPVDLFLGCGPLLFHFFFSNQGPGQPRDVQLKLWHPRFVRPGISGPWCIRSLTQKIKEQLSLGGNDNHITCRHERSVKDCQRVWGAHVRNQSNTIKLIIQSARG